MVKPMKAEMHGTYSGYSAHHYRGEEACDACKAGLAMYGRQWRASGSESALKANARRAADSRARKRLSEMHPEEFLDLQEEERRAAGV